MKKRMSPVQKKLMYQFVDWPNDALCICGHTKQKHTYYNPAPYVRKWMPCRCKGTRACDCQGFVPESLPEIVYPIVETQAQPVAADDGAVCRRISL
jgi:hypothetical protein